jgi:methyl-accepting chemotaxis protein
MKKRSISTKVNTAIITISVISLVAISAILFYLQNNTKTEVYKNIQQELVTAANAKLKAKGSIGLTNALSIANDGRIKKSLKQNDRKWAILSLSTIAKLVVANANAKEFIGKDSVTAKDMGNT